MENFSYPIGGSQYGRAALEKMNRVARMKSMLNQKVITEGLDMKCRPVIATGILRQIVETGFFVFESRGMRTLIDPERYKGIYLDTRENRKWLKSCF